MEWECDKLLQHPNPSNINIKELKERKLRAFKQIFEWHYGRCSEYRKYCELHGIKPEDIKAYDDLAKIQPIPSDVFRDSEKLILSIPKNEIATILTTSSTTSSKSVRFSLDKITLNRTINSCAKHWKDVMELQTNADVIFLTPAPEETDVGLVNGTYLSFKRMGFSDKDIMFSVKKGILDSDEVLKVILNSNRPQYLYGPPFAVLYLVKHIENIGRKLKLHKDARVITTGGWKGAEGIPREEFNKRVAKAFGIKEEQIRDGLGTTDIMTMLPECKYHKKHVPPWIHISVRNPKNITEETPEGETGLLIYMSSLIQSYPAFCMPADMGAVWETTCKCGRTGQIVEHRGRAKALGARGCAIRLEEFMNIITKK